MYHAFLSGNATMEARINEGGGTETQHATQFDTQTDALDIEEKPLFDKNLARQAKGGSKRSGGYTKLEDVFLSEALNGNRTRSNLWCRTKGGTFYIKKESFVNYN
jgi:hypothetical protein